MNGQDLKNSILQLAIQGKLVEQRKEEGSTRELIEQIINEKEQLIKEKKIKKEKSLPKINEDEIPFDIPANWEWVRLGTIVSVYGGKRIPAGKSLVEENTGHKYIRVADMKNGSIMLDNIKYIPNDIYQKIKNYTISKDDIYITVAGTIGQVGTVPEELNNANLTENANKLIMYSNYKEYIYNILSSPFIQYQIKEATTKVGQPKLAIMRIKTLIIPLPPLEEQKRIVAKIEELMPYVDEYDNAHSKVEELNKKFPEDMQKSILQYAIQGKLVEQWKEEGTAEELYNQIQDEKKRLVKEGEIKATRKLPEITVDEISFDIPESWKWVRLGDLIHLTSGQDMTPDKYNDVSNGMPYLTGASNIQNGEILINRWTNEPKSIALRGDILLTCKGTVGKTVILKEDEVHIARQIMSIRTVITDSEFIQYFVMSYISILKSKAKSMIPGIERKDVLEAPLALPPFEEQKRIVAKIEKLLPYTKQLVK